MTEMRKGGLGINLKSVMNFIIITFSAKLLEKKKNREMV